MAKKRFVIAISGASGAVYGVRLLDVLVGRPDIETHLIISQIARQIIPAETDCTVTDVEALADHAYAFDDLAAPIASGSFTSAGMIIAPCSIKTLSAVANSYAADLIARAADVTLKEGRSLVLLVRETPLHPGHLHLMTRVAEIGGVIFPPVPAFYGRPQSLDEVIDGTVGRVLMRLGVENDLYTEWLG